MYICGRVSAVGGKDALNGSDFDSHVLYNIIRGNYVIRIQEEQIDTIVDR